MSNRVMRGDGASLPPIANHGRLWSELLATATAAEDLAHWLGQIPPPPVCAPPNSSITLVYLTPLIAPARSDDADVMAQTRAMGALYTLQWRTPLAEAAAAQLGEGVAKCYHAALRLRAVVEQLWDLWHTGETLAMSRRADRWSRREAPPSIVAEVQSAAEVLRRAVKAEYAIAPRDRAPLAPPLPPMKAREEQAAKGVEWRWAKDGFYRHGEKYPLNGQRLKLLKTFVAAGDLGDGYVLTHQQINDACGEDTDRPGAYVCELNKALCALWKLQTRPIQAIRGERAYRFVPPLADPHFVRDS